MHEAGHRLCIFLVLDASICHPLPDSSLILGTYIFFCGYGSRPSVSPDRIAVVPQHGKGNSCPREVRQMTRKVVCSNQFSLIFFFFKITGW